MAISNSKISESAKFTCMVVSLLLGLTAKFQPNFQRKGRAFNKNPLSVFQIKEEKSVEPQPGELVGVNLIQLFYGMVQLQYSIIMYSITVFGIAS